MKTAVEFLESEMQKVVYIAKSNKVKFDELVDQAKEIEKEQRGYSEEEVLEVFEHFKMDLPFHYEFLVKEHLQQLKQQEQ
jgi:hypothetical protein